MNRRKFLSYVGCGCGSLILPSCTTAPITDRKQLKIVSEARLNAQAAQIYEKVKEKEKMSNDTKTLNEIKEIGKKWKILFLNILIERTWMIQQKILIGNTF